MTPTELLRTLRAKGYEVTEREGRIAIRGPAPKDESAAVDVLRSRKAELLEVLRTEGSEVVRSAMAALGAELVSVRLSTDPSLRWPEKTLVLDYARLRNANKTR